MGAHVFTRSAAIVALLLALAPVRALAEPPTVQERIEAQRARTRARNAERQREREAKRVARDLELDSRETRRFVKLHRR